MDRRRSRFKVFLKIVAGGIFSMGLFVFDPDSALAVSVDMTGVPEVVSEEPFTVDVSLDGAKEGTNYLRLDLYKDGTKNYFSETFNGSAWYGGSDGKQYWAVAVGNEHKVSTTIKARIGNPSEQEFSGDGVYKLRVRRYTTSGSQSSGDQQTPVDIRVLRATPTPSPSVIVTPLPTPSPTPVPTVMLTASIVVAPTTTSRSYRTPSSTPVITAKPLATSVPSVGKLNNRLLPTSIEAAISDSGQLWQVNLSTTSAEVLGSSAANLPSSTVATETFDKRIPFVLSGAGLALVLLGFSSGWWRKPPQTIN